MNKSSSKLSIHHLVAIGFMAALVFVASLISIPVPVIAGVNTRIHLGNVFCVLSGLLLGSVKGGLSAGLGSMLFDLVNPLYIASAPFTLVFKFLIGFFSGKIAYAGGKGGKSAAYNTLGGLTGSLVYVVLYVAKNFITDVYFLRTEIATAWIDAAQKGGISLINGVLAVVIAVPLSIALGKALSKSTLYQKVTPLAQSKKNEN